MTSDRLKRLNAFLQERPNDPFLHYARLLEYIRLGSPENIAECLEYLLTNHPDYLGTYYTAGSYFERTGNITQAAELLSKGLDLALAAGDKKTAGELQTALDLLED